MLAEIIWIASAKCSNIMRLYVRFRDGYPETLPCVSLYDKASIIVIIVA